MMYPRVASSEYYDRSIHRGNICMLKYIHHYHLQYQVCCRIDLKTAFAGIWYLVDKSIFGHRYSLDY